MLDLKEFWKSELMKKATIKFPSEESCWWHDFSLGQFDLHKHGLASVRRESCRRADSCRYCRRLEDESCRYLDESWKCVHIMRSCRHIPLSIECHHYSQHTISNFHNIYSFHLSERRLVVSSSGKSKASRVSSAKIPASSLTNLIFPWDLWDLLLLRAECSGKLPNLLLWQEWPKSLHICRKGIFLLNSGQCLSKKFGFPLILDPILRAVFLIKCWLFPPRLKQEIKIPLSLFLTFLAVVFWQFCPNIRQCLTQKVIIIFNS